MSKISFREEEEGHNFWQNYTDLMSGFLIVFIITSLAAYGSYRAAVNAMAIDADSYHKIRDFQKAQESLNCRHIKYNTMYQRFECTVDVLFRPQSAEIPENCRQELIEAGREVENLVRQYEGSNNIAFKIVVEGRAAKQWDKPNPTNTEKAYAARLSYERARNLYVLWTRNGLLRGIESQNGEVFVSGSGYEGNGRYTGYGPNGEERNKTFIIQIIPYIKN